MYSGVANRFRFFAYIIFLLPLTILASTAAVAVDTTVSTSICNADAGSSASLVIDSPVSDSVVNLASITLTGSVKDVSQIDISIDGDYSQTVAIGAGMLSFSIGMTLSPGTHTILASGVDVCNITDPSDTVVVTYQPDTQPSTGSETPTVTTGSNPTVGGPGNNPIESDDKDTWVNDIPLLPQALTVARGVGQNLDFDELAKDGTLKAVTRFGFFTLGVSTMLAGPWLLNLLGRGGVFLPVVLVRLRRNEWLTRVVGAILILLTFMI